MEINQGELRVLSQVLGGIKSSKSMSGSDYFNILDLKECVQESMEKLSKAQKEIIDTFKVEITPEGSVKDVESKEFLEAAPKLEALLMVNVPLSPVNFIESKEVFKDMLEDLTIEAASYLRKYLFVKS